MADTTDDLLRRARSGHAPAIEELLALHLPGLRAYIRLQAGPVVRGRESVSDLAQSVCREVLEHVDRFQHGGEAGFRQWLYSTALRTIRNRAVYWQRHKRDVAREVPITPAAAAGHSAADLAIVYRSLSSPSQRAMGLEDLERIEQAFDALAEDDREIIVMARIAGLSHREIAAELDTTEGACRVRLNRALARLATILDRPAI